MNSLYNEIYLAPKFANLICDTLGLSGYYLPQGLKCNNLTYNKPEEPDPEPTVYSITVAASGCAVSGASTITEGGTATLTATADSGYSLPDAVTVIGASYSWNSATGVLTLSAPTGAVSVTVTAVKEAEPEPIPLFDRNGNRIQIRDRLWVKSSGGMTHPAHIYDKSGNKIQL